LASKLTKESINFSQLDNMFVDFTSFEQAQEICDQLTVDEIHEKLDMFAKQFCPVINKLEQSYHWSIMQAEYATDIVFKQQQDLQRIYDQLVQVAIHTVKPDNIATFLGKKLHFNYQGEMGNNFNTRIEGTRIKHSMGPVSIKMYDKLGLVLRIETTVNDVSFFKHYRKVEHRDGTQSRKLAQMKKGIYSLTPLRDLLSAANHRYLQFISAKHNTGQLPNYKHYVRSIDNGSMIVTIIDVMNGNKLGCGVPPPTTGVSHPPEAINCTEGIWN